MKPNRHSGVESAKRALDRVINPPHPRYSSASLEWLERSMLAVSAPCAVKDKGAALSRKTVMRRFRRSRSP
jgi:hypothetical protein